MTGIDMQRLITNSRVSENLEDRLERGSAAGKCIGCVVFTGIAQTNLRSYGLTKRPDRKAVLVLQGKAKDYWIPKASGAKSVIVYDGVQHETITVVETTKFNDALADYYVSRGLAFPKQFCGTDGTGTIRILSVFEDFGSAALGMISVDVGIFCYLQKHFRKDVNRYFSLPCEDGTCVRDNVIRGLCDSGNARALVTVAGWRQCLRPQDLDRLRESAKDAKDLARVIDRVT